MLRNNLKISNSESCFSSTFHSQYSNREDYAKHSSSANASALLNIQRLSEFKEIRSVGIGRIFFEFHLEEQSRAGRDEVTKLARNSARLNYPRLS